MINLLPPTARKELVASRTNTLLLRYVFLLLSLVGLLIVEMAVVFVFLSTSKASNQATITENASKTAAYASTSQQADAFKSNLAVAKVILSKQVPYTKILQVLSDAMPPGTIIDKISIDPSTFGAPTTLSIRAKNYDDAIALRNNLNKSTAFSDVNFQSITLQQQDKTGYAYTATLNVTFKKEVLGL